MADERVVKVTRWFKLEYEAPVSAYGLTEDEVRGLEKLPFSNDDLATFAGALREVENDVAIVTVQR